MKCNPELMKDKKGHRKKKGEKNQEGGQIMMHRMVHRSSRRQSHQASKGP